MRANPFLHLQWRTPSLRAEDAARIAREAFDLMGDAEDVGSHQDQNFRIVSYAGTYVLKIANHGSSRAELDLQNHAMHRASARLGALVQTPLPGRDGQEIVVVEHGGRHYHARLLPYLDGVPLRAWGHLGSPVLRDAGRIAGQVSSALEELEHPAADRVLQWDVQRVAEVVEALAGCIRHSQDRALVERTYQAATRSLDDLNGDLRRQIIHGDVTDWNLLAARDPAGRPRLCGLLDFGDVTRSWLAAECAVPAVAAAEHHPRRALQSAVEVVRGFHSARPLLDVEVAALPALMAARAVLSAVACEHQAVADPGNAYALQSAVAAWSRLTAIAAIPIPLAYAAFASACDAPLPVTPEHHLAGSPLIEGWHARGTAPLDLSVTTAALEPGAWSDSQAVAAVIEARQRSSVAFPVAGHGQRRITSAGEPRLDEPDTLHLGTDIFAAEGTAVRAPVDGRVLGIGECDIVLAVSGGFVLRLAGVTPVVGVGDDVQRGFALGHVATSPAGALPAHVHVQLARDRLEEMPDDVPASLAAAWLHLCPDPALLLGFDAVQAREPDREGVLTRRLRFLGSPYGLYYPSDPPQIERGWKQWLYDVDGRCYLDVVNNIAAVGHSHPRVEAAATRQLRMLNTNSRFLYSAMGRLAERLVSLVPEPMDTVFLLSSGSEANDLALQLARRATGHRDVVCFEGAYHGWTAATNVLMTGSDVTGAVRPVHQLSKPEASAASDRVAGGTARFADQACDAIEAMAEQGRPPAAFLCEPLLCNSGGVLLPDCYLERVYRAVREAGGVCVADEVQVGYGRLGHHFWAFEQQNVVPDIVTIAKSAGNGYPVAAVITTRAIADQFHQPERSFFSSVAGSPVACEVAIAVLDVMEEEGLQHNATVVGDYLHACLEPMAAMHPMVGAALGMGLYRGIPLLRDGDPDRPATEEAGAICERMRDLGVIVQATGEGRNVLKVKPPLCITRHDIDFFISALERTLTGGW